MAVRKGSCTDCGVGPREDRRLPVALPCRSVSTTLWRCAAACPPTPGCMASSAAPRCPRSSPPRATTCVWSSSQTTRSPNGASGPTSFQVWGLGGQVPGRGGHGCVGSQPRGHLLTPSLPTAPAHSISALEVACPGPGFVCFVIFLYWWLYYYRAVVTNCHKVGGLKSQGSLPVPEARKVY